MVVTEDLSVEFSLSLSLFFFFFFLPRCSGLLHLSSPTRDRTRPLAVKARSPNRWTAREFPLYFSFPGSIFLK